VFAQVRAAKIAGAVFTAISAMLYKCSIRTEIKPLNCLIRTITSLKVLVDAPTSPSNTL
jgi:hypothetical protein